MKAQHQNLVASSSALNERLVQACLDARNFEQILCNIQSPLSECVPVAATSLCIAGHSTVYVSSERPLSDETQLRIMSHVSRCIPTKTTDGTHLNEPTLQQVGTVTHPQSRAEPIAIAWTGAVETQGRLVAVLTFYVESGTSLNNADIVCLRAVRDCVARSIGRIRLVSRPAKKAPLAQTTVCKPETMLALHVHDDSRFIDSQNCLSGFELRNATLSRIQSLGIEFDAVAPFGTHGIMIVDQSIGHLDREEWLGLLNTLETELEQELRVDIRIKVEFCTPIPLAQSEPEFAVPCAGPPAKTQTNRQLAV
ncbi:MAG: hypothetical protein ACON3Z_12815 [Bradymonadia bacterium]